MTFSGSGFSCCGAQALGTQASVAVAHGLSSHGKRIVPNKVQARSEQ